MSGSSGESRGPCGDRNDTRKGASSTKIRARDADKVTITIQDVIADNGPLVPSFEDLPKAYNTAIVAVTLHGRRPSAAMLTQLEGIAAA